MPFFTITKWRCDRCGLVQDREPEPGPRHRYDVIVSARYQGGPSAAIINWQGMCDACNAEVGPALEALRRKLAKPAEEGGNR